MGCVTASSALDYVFPEDARIIDVKRDFQAKGDGIGDDTSSLQQAISLALSGDYRNPKMIYLPRGTYLISKPLRARITDAPDGEGGWCDGWRCGIFLVGQNREDSVIKLADRAPGFEDPAKPRAMIVTGSTGHGKNHDSRIGGWGNEAFQNTLMNFTVDTGACNPGAIGVDFLASNRGSVVDVTVRSGAPDKSGVCGIEMSRPWPGPGLVQHVSVDGFDYGIRQRHMDCSMTFEHVTLTNQRQAGILASGSPTMSFRKLSSANRVPALIGTERCSGGFFMLLDSQLTYTGDDTPPAAIESEAHLLLKHVDVQGYRTVVKNTGSKKPQKKGRPPLREDLVLDANGHVDFYIARDPLRLFPGPEEVPDLPVKETPRWHGTDLSTWTSIVAHGARPRGKALDFTSIKAFERVDPEINFGWGGGGPRNGLANDNFSIRWTGAVRPPADGTYTFYVHVNDKARLWVDGQLIVDQWERYYSKEYAGTVALQGGRRVPLKLEYHESGHDAWVRMSWSGPRVAKQIIPSDLLYPTVDAAEAGGLTGQYFGNSNTPCAAQVQAAIDSGKEVVYFPNGKYSVNGTIVLRGNVKKLIGMEAALEGAVIRYDGTSHDVAFIEHLNGIQIVHNCDRQLVVRRCNLKGYENTEQGSGDMFLEDNMGARSYINYPQNLWARQLNVEYGRRPLLINNGGNVWILGMKTEGMFSQLVNKGGVLECYALYSMTNPPPAKEMPMIVNQDGFMAVSFADGGQKSFWTKIKETHNGQTKSDETWRRETMLFIGGQKQ
jgi:hypothetical protein